MSNTTTNPGGKTANDSDMMILIPLAAIMVVMAIIATSLAS